MLKKKILKCINIKIKPFKLFKMLSIHHKNVLTVKINLNKNIISSN